MKVKLSVLFSAFHQHWSHNYLFLL